MNAAAASEFNKSLGRRKDQPAIMTLIMIVERMAEACQHFETPVTGGNVSFYNETLGEGIYPTPVIGMVGLIQPVSRTKGSWFVKQGHLIVLLGKVVEENEYCQAVSRTLTELGGTKTSSDFYTEWMNQLPCPALSLELEARVQKTCLEASDLIVSAHDCSDGGLAVALAEMSFSHFTKPALGAEIEIPGDSAVESILFGEFQSRILVTLEEKNLASLQAIAYKNSVDLLQLGRIEGNRLSIKVGKSLVIDEPISVLEDTWRNSISRYFRN